MTSDDKFAFAKDIFYKAPFIREMGYQLEEIEAGYVCTSLQVEEKHKQQHGFVHAGVLATMADHSAGACGATMLEAEKDVLTAEFKVNFLRPALGDFFLCEATMLKPGRQLSVVESSVYSIKDGTKKLCTKATVTLCIVPRTTLLP